MRGTALPAVVVAGYLGAGKTTLINRLLSANLAHRLAVLVNDFGAINIDEDLIASHDGTTIALTNGCVCCTIGNDLSAALEDVRAQREDFDVLVVEASGVAEPDRIGAHLSIWQDIDLRQTLVLVDATAIQRLAGDRYVGRLVRRQMAAASRTLISKGDLVQPGQLLQLQAWLAEQTEAVVEPLARDALDFDALLAPAVQTNTQTVAEHSQFHSVALVLGAKSCAQAALREVLASAPPGVHRLKGTVRLRDGGTLLVQLSGSRVQLTPIDSGPSRLVVIGPLPHAKQVEAFAARLRQLFLPA